MKYASIGTISHGTLRTDGLLDAFAGELEYQVQRNADEWCSAQGRINRDNFLRLVNAARETAPDGEDAAELANEIAEALEHFAPWYCYFGAHEGDGSDFGFWPSMDAISELPRVEGSDAAKALGEDCVFVNDHGNVTVFGGDGSVLWDCVSHATMQLFRRVTW
jgi:hypothetical protein